MGLFICEPKFLAPRQNFGLEFWPGKNEPKISAWNSRPEFQAEISGRNFRPEFQAEKKMCLILFSCLPNANLGIKVLMLLWFLALNWIQKPGKSKLFMIFWHGIFWLEISAWNFGLKFWPEKIKPEILAWKTGPNSRPEISAWKAISARRWIDPK